MENLNEPNPDFISQVTGYIRVGADFILAAEAIGVTYAKAHEWQARSEKAFKKQSPGIWLDLANSIRSAMAHAEIVALQRIAAEGGSSGAKWFLENFRPEKYGKNHPGKPVKKGSDEMEFEQWEA